MLDALNLISSIFGETPEGDTDNDAEEDKADDSTEPSEDVTEEGAAEDDTDDTVDTQEPDALDAKPEDAKPEQVYPASYVKELREENKKRRLREKALLDENSKMKKEKAGQAKAAKLAKMDELERVKAEKAETDALYSDAVSALEYANRSSAVVGVAADLGFLAPSDAVALLGSKLDALTIDEKGNLDTADVKDALSELLQEKPYLARVQEDKAAVEAAKATNQPSDAQAKRQKSVKGDTDDDVQTSKQITELNRQGQGDAAYGLWWKKYLRGRTKHYTESSEPYTAR